MAKLSSFHQFTPLAHTNWIAKEKCTVSITFSKVSVCCHQGLFASPAPCGEHYRSVWQANLNGLKEFAFTTLISAVIYASNVGFSFFCQSWLPKWSSWRLVPAHIMKVTSPCRSSCKPKPERAWDITDGNVDLQDVRKCIYNILQNNHDDSASISVRTVVKTPAVRV